MRRLMIAMGGNIRKTRLRVRIGRLSAIAVLSLAATSCASSTQKQARSEIGAIPIPRVLQPASVRMTGVADLPVDAGLSDVLRYAVENNPGVAAAFARWQAAIERIDWAGMPPEPRLSFGYYFENVETRVGPQEWSASVAQTFPWFGTLGLRTDIAATQARARGEEFQQSLDQLYFAVVSAWAEYFYLQRSTTVTQETLNLVGNAESVAQAKYRGGDGPYADVIRAQVELGRLEDRLTALTEQLRPSRARLNALLNRPPDAALAPPSELPSDTLVVGDDAIRARAQAMHPGLRKLILAAAAEADAVRLASRAGWPSFTFGVDYISTGPALDPNMPGSGTDPLIGRFSINIPLWRGAYGAKKREAETRQRAYELEREQTANDLTAKVEGVLFAYHDADRKTDLYSNALLPKAAQAIRAAQTGYEAGEIDFLDFLDAQHVQLEFQIAYDRARADRLTHLAELRMLTSATFAETEYGIRSHSDE